MFYPEGTTEYSNYTACIQYARQQVLYAQTEAEQIARVLTTKAAQLEARLSTANTENERLKRIIANYLARESADQQVISAQISPVADEVPAQITKEATPIPLEPMDDDNYDAFLDEPELFSPNIFRKLERARRLALQASWSSESVNRSMLNLTMKMDVVVGAIMEKPCQECILGTCDSLHDFIGIYPI